MVITLNKRIPLPKTKTTVTPKNDILNYYCFSAGGTWYYDHFHELHNPPSIYQYLLSTAKETVWIWDPYIHPDDATVLNDIQREVDVRILTCKGIQKNVIPENYKKFLEKVEPIQQVNGFKLEFAIYNKLRDGEKEAFHDRYLFVDNNVYAVGASVEYHRRRVTSTAIHLIESYKAYQLVTNRFLNMWKHENTLMAHSASGGLL